MKFKFPAVMATALMAMALAGCGQAPTKAGEPQKEPVIPMISEEARDALARAEADVAAAQARFALWTSAATALKNAQEAAKAGDSNGVIQHARYATEQVRGGMEQLSYPATEPR